MAVKSTAPKNLPPLKPEEILCTATMFKFINPVADIRLAAGRKLLPDNGASAF